MIGYQPVEMWRRSGRSVGAGAGILGDSVNDDMKLLGLQPEWAVFRDIIWRDKCLNKHGRTWHFKINDDNDDDEAFFLKIVLTLIHDLPLNEFPAPSVSSLNHSGLVSERASDHPNLLLQMEVSGPGRIQCLCSLSADVPRWGLYGVAEQKGVWRTVVYNGFRFILGYSD